MSFEKAFFFFVLVICEILYRKYHNLEHETIHFTAGQIYILLALLIFRYDGNLSLKTNLLDLIGWYKNEHS